MGQIQVQPQQADSPVLPVAVSSFISLAIAGFLAKWAFTYIFSQWQRQVEELKSEVKALKIDRAEYVTKEEFLRVTMRFEEHLDRFGAKIDRLLEK